jgi:antitoxin ParD1/3/4
MIANSVRLASEEQTRTTWLCHPAERVVTPLFGAARRSPCAGGKSMPTRNINLTEHFDKFIHKEVESGKFGNASEVVREGLRMMERRNQEDRARLDWLRGAVQEGISQIDRGEAMEFSSVGDLDRYIDRIGNEVAGERSSHARRSKVG